MKRFRTVLSVLLALALVFGALPLTAYADEVYVESVGIYSIDEPVAGRNPDYLYSTEVVREYNGYSVSSVEWLDVAAGTPMQPDDTFVEGREYALCVTVKAEDDLIFCFDKENENYTLFNLNLDGIEAEPGDDASTAIMQKVYTCVAGDPIQYISAVTIDLPALYAGEEFPFDEVGICKTDGVSVKCETRGFNGDPNYPYMFNGIVYLTYDTSKVKTPEDLVEADTLYRIQLTLETWPGYEFATDDQGNADIAVTVNGGELIDWFSTGDYGRQAIVRARITSQDAPEYTIGKADVFSIDEPIAGRTPDYEFAFEVEDDKIIRFRRDYDVHDDYSCYGVMWHDNTDNVDLKPTDTFIKDHSYTVTVVLKASKHYYFNFDESDPNANTRFYINHDFAEEYYAYDDTNEGAVLKKTFTCIEGDAIKIISEIYITTTDPVAGEKGAFTAESLTEGVSIDVTVTELMYEGARDVTFINGVSYAPVGGGVCITEDDTFAPNTKYTVGIAIHTDDGYELLSEKGTEVWEPDVYINGEPVYFAYAQPGDDYLRSAILHRQVTTGDAEAAWNLDITMDEPALGGTPDRDIEVESDGYDVSVSHVGYVFDGLEGDEANVPDDYVFQAGDKIWLAIYVSVFDDQGEELALSADLMPAVTVNGTAVEANYVSNAVTVIQMYEIEAQETEDIDKVDVYDLDAPIAGRTPDYNFSRYKKENAEFCDYYLSTDHDNEYTRNSIRWHDDTDDVDLKTDDTFIEGHQYTVTVTVTTDNGHAFNYGEDGTEFLIDHEPADSAEAIPTVTGVAVMKKTFTCVAGAPVKIIDAIVITTPEPVGGSLAPFTAEVETEGVIVEPLTLNLVESEIHYWFDGISYIHDGLPIDTEHVVIAGDNYYFGVLLEAEDGYEFAVDEDMDPAVKVTINGVETDLIRTAGYDTSHHGGAAIDMTAGEEDLSIITNAVYVTLTEPAAGETPDFTATAEGSVQLTGNREVLWAEVDSEGGFTALMEDDSTYESGRYYMATVTISAAPGFAFDAESLPKVFFNGNEAAVEGNDAVITATYIYMLGLPGSKKYIVGDVNGDGAVKNRDALILDRYIAGWKDFDKQIKNWKAADINRDGQVKNRDALSLDRYIAGWKSYEKYIFEVNEEDDA